MANVTADVPSNFSLSKNPIAALAVSVTGQPDAVAADVAMDAFAKLTLKQLQEAATTLGLSSFSRLKKDGLVKAIGTVGRSNFLGRPTFRRRRHRPRSALPPRRTFRLPPWRAPRGAPDTAEMLYVACGGEGRDEVIRQVESSLEKAGLGIDVSIPVSLLRSAVGGHMAVLLGLLLGLAALMTLVGVLGLTAAMSTGVVERTRELGVMQAVGATPSLVLRVILAEGLFVGLLSSVLAVVLSLPLTALVGGILGRLSFRVPLPLCGGPRRRPHLDRHRHRGFGAGDGGARMARVTDDGPGGAGV